MLRIATTNKCRVSQWVPSKAGSRFFPGKRTWTAFDLFLFFIPNVLSSTIFFFVCSTFLLAFSPAFFPTTHRDVSISGLEQQLRSIQGHSSSYCHIANQVYPILAENIPRWRQNVLFPTCDLSEGDTRECSHLSAKPASHANYWRIDPETLGAQRWYVKPWSMWWF